MLSGIGRGCRPLSLGFHQLRNFRPLVANLNLKPIDFSLRILGGATFRVYRFSRKLVYAFLKAISAGRGLRFDYRRLTCHHSLPSK
jgi:hypothetical protein